MSDQPASSPAAPPPGEDCPLPVPVQVRNIALYAVFWCIYYFAAPVSYVGLTHANVLKDLGNNDTVSNLPAAVYQWLAVVPVLIAWMFRRPKHLKPLALLSVGVMAAATAAVAVTMWSGASPRIVTCVVIAHGAAFGAANGVLIMALWDFLRSGVSTSRRGQALGFTFSIGPLFACVGALLQDALLEGKLTGFSFGLSFPDNYMAMFAGVAPLMLAATLVVASFTLPEHAEPAVDDELLSEDVLPSREIVEGLRQFVFNRAALLAVVLYIVVGSGGSAILQNVSLSAPKDTLGVQTFLRFSFKAVTGAMLGLLLAKTSPRTTLLATTSILVLGMGWALASTGDWFLLAFGLLGAGELYGCYFPNYVTTASPKPFVRMNIAYMTVLGALIGFSSILFGLISDMTGRFSGQAAGRIASFYAATLILVLALVAIRLLLPANPTPRE